MLKRKTLLNPRWKKRESRGKWLDDYNRQEPLSQSPLSSSSS